MCSSGRHLDPPLGGRAKAVAPAASASPRASPSTQGLTQQPLSKANEAVKYWYFTHLALAVDAHQVQLIAIEFDLQLQFLN